MRLSPEHKELMVGFEPWLLEQRNLSLSSVAQYASGVRAWLRASIDVSDRDAVLAFLRTRSAATAVRDLRAYRFFREFRLAQGDTEGDRPECAVDMSILPDDVNRAIAILMNSTKYQSLIVRLRWQDVDKATGRLNVPGKSNEWYAKGSRIKEALEVMWTWGMPITETAPVFPNYPTSHSCRAVKYLRQDCERGNQILWKEHQEARDAFYKDAETAQEAAPWVPDENTTPDTAPTVEAGIEVLRRALGREPTLAERRVYGLAPAETEEERAARVERPKADVAKMLS